MALFLLVGVLVVVGCTAGGESAATTNKRVESYLRALASGDQDALNDLSYAEVVEDVGQARRDAFGSSEATSFVSVAIGSSKQSKELGSIGGDTGDMLLVPATLETREGRKLKVEVQVWIPPGKPSSIGPASNMD